MVSKSYDCAKATISLDCSNSFPLPKDCVQIHQTPFPSLGMGSGHEIAGAAIYYSVCSFYSNKYSTCHYYKVGKCTCKYMYESDLYIRTVESCNSFLHASTEQNRGEG